VRWDFTALEPYEERVITYRLKSTLSILGDLDMPPTVLKYTTSDNKVKKVEFKSFQIEE
jgi:hypothetical protein